MRLIDADKLKRHFAWWDDNDTVENAKEVFNTIIDLQPTVEEREVSRENNFNQG